MANATPVCRLSNLDSFDFVESDLVARTVVELGRPRRLVGGDGLGILDGASIFQICRDPGCSKRVAANVVWQASRFGSSLDHS